jgi:Mor family transcriptional regulator
MRKYNNAKKVLPQSLIEEIQKYIDGTHIYIPSKEKKAWGIDSGAREQLDKRNLLIIDGYINGMELRTLAELYGLSEERIKSIVYGVK